MTSLPRAHLLASTTEKAQSAAAALEGRYPDLFTTSPQDADLLVVVGGDGFMLEAFHHYRSLSLPFYGLNLETAGFLLNSFVLDGLPQRLQRATPARIHPLEVTGRTEEKEITLLAVNDAYLMRSSPQTAHLQVSVDGAVRLPELVGDGILVATAAGSAAYNASLHGPILPLTANLMALTPISAFRPRRWPGALLPQSAVVEVEVLDSKKRPVSLTADNTQVENIVSATISSSPHPLTLLFDADHHLEERIMKEQFLL